MWNQKHMANVTIYELYSSHIFNGAAESFFQCFVNFWSAEAQKRKSKWDSAIPVTLAQPTLITTTATLPAVVSVTTTASGTKTTVISAVGTILKKAKQWTQGTDGYFCDTLTDTKR